MLHTDSRAQPSPARADDRRGARTFAEPDRLDLPVANYVNLEPIHGGSRGTGVAEIDSSHAHSGTDSLHLAVPDVSRNRRAEWAVRDMEALVGARHYTVESWMYVPADWDFNVEGIDWNWYMFAQFYTPETPQPGGAYAPYTSFLVQQPDITTPVFRAHIGGRNSDNVNADYVVYEGFPLPRGRWFEVRYYIDLRTEDAGTARLWVDGIEVGEATGLDTPRGDWYSTVAKVYHHEDEPERHDLWFDDLTIYRGLAAP